MAEQSVGDRAAAQSQSALGERQLCPFFSIQHYISKNKPKMISRRLDALTIQTIFVGPPDCYFTVHFTGIALL